MLNSGNELRSVLGVFVLAAATFGSAFAKDAWSDISLEELLNVEVTSVSRLAQPLNEAPAPVTVIDRQMIKNAGAWDLADVFRLVPGMYVAYNASNTYTINSSVSNHGLTDAFSRRMQVLVDGRSIYSPLFGGVLWSDIPLALDDIERIEVIRGPNSASYGANSFLGIINIITRRPSDQQGTSVSAATGRGRDEMVMRHGDKSGNLSYRVTASVRNDQGEDLRPVQASKYDDKKIRMLTLSADYKLGAVDALEFQLGYNGGRRQEGDVGGSFFPRWKSVDNHFELLRWSRHIEGGSELSVQFYHSYEGAKDTTVATVPPNVGLGFNNDVTAQRTDLEVQHFFVPFENTRLVWGGSVRLDSTLWPLYLHRQDALDFHLARAFGNLEWRIQSDFLLNVGAMAENNDFTGTNITPRLAANWHFAPGHTLRTSYSTATRTPSLVEEKVDLRYRVPSHLPLPYPSQADLIFFSATGGLKPERIRSSEMGYVGKLGVMDLDFRVFRDELTELISTYKYNPCPSGPLPLTGPGILCVGADVTNFRNTGRAVVKGVEGQLQWRIDDSSQLVYSMSRILISSRNEDGIDYAHAVPEMSHSLMLSHSFNPHWNGSLLGYYVGKNFMPGGGAMIDSNRRLDMRLARSFRCRNRDGEVTLAVQNLTNNREFEYNKNNQLPGRTAWLNVKLDL